MARFLYEFRLIGDWFRQFLYDISEAFLDREWIYYEDHYESVWFGIIYTLIALAILPFAVDLLFTFILSFRLKKLVFFHTVFFRGLKTNDLKGFKSSSDLKRFSLNKADRYSLSNNRVFTFTGNRLTASAVASDVKNKSNDNSVRFIGHSSYIRNRSSFSYDSSDMKNNVGINPRSNENKYKNSQFKNTRPPILIRNKPKKNNK